MPAHAWQSQPMMLALAHYMGQERVANVAMLAAVAAVAPDALVRAVRCSGLVLTQHSPRRTELDQLAASSPVIAELCKVLDIFDVAHRERTGAVFMWQHRLAELSPLELLSYASLHAFEHLVPAQFGVSLPSSCPQPDMQAVWDAINDILLWKLSTCADTSLKLSDAVIGQALAQHLSPFLFPSPQGQDARHDLREAFANLLAAQTELNSFVTQSANAFSYDHSIEFVRAGDRLEIREVDALARAAWQRDGHKLAALHNYWYYRAVDAFVDSGMATLQIGSAENHETNRVAYIKAIRTQLQLTEVYGIGPTVTTDAGDTVPLFQALLSLELMNVFFQRDFLESYLTSSPPLMAGIPSAGRPCPAASACADSFSKTPTFRTPLRGGELPEISVLDSDCLMAKEFEIFVAPQIMLAPGDSLDLGVNPEACARKRVKVAGGVQHHIHHAVHVPVARCQCANV